MSIALQFNDLDTEAWFPHWPGMPEVAVFGFRPGGLRGPSLARPTDDRSLLSTLHEVDMGKRGFERIGGSWRDEPWLPLYPLLSVSVYVNDFYIPVHGL